MNDNIDPAFLAFLQQEETRSYDGSLLEEVEAAIDSYNGAPYGDEEDGRSQVVTRDVAEVVDHMTVSIARTIISGDRVVELEPADESQEQAADDATESLHRDMRLSGYRLIHDWIKAGLLEKIGIVKTCVERKKERVEQVVPAELLPGATEEELRAAGIIEAEEVEPGVFKVVLLQDASPKFPDYNVPLEEFRFAPDARDLESAVYLAHVCEKTRSELVEMGFDREAVEGLSGETNPQFDSLARARDDGRNDWGNDRQGANRKVWLFEEYVRYDLNGDGVAERLCVHRVGNTVLSIEEVDYQPFEFWTPFPMPGRMVGQSLADKVIDIQRVTTVLERHALDSLYMSLSPGTMVNEDSLGDHTIDDLLTIRPGRLVRYRGAVAPIPEVRQDTSSTAFQAIEFKIGQRESRTGITRMNQGLDADALNKTATGTALMQAQGQQIEEYLARNFAEALARLFRKKLTLRARYGEPFAMRVDGEFRQVDPRQWGEEMDVQIRVGLGSGKKDQRIAYRMQIAQMQSAALTQGLEGVTAKEVFNTVAGMVKDMGLGAPSDYWQPPQTDEQGNPVQGEEKPDPEMMKAQAELQMKQAEMEQNAQLKAMDIEGKQQEAALKLELMRAEATERAQLERDKAEFEREQAIAQMQFEMAMRQKQFEQEAAMARYKADQDADLKKYREGGDLSK